MLFIAVEDFTSVIQMSVNEQQTSCLMTGARNIEMSVALVFVDSTSVPPPPCVCIHCTAECRRIGLSIIDMTTALSFCLDAYVAEAMHYFVCCSREGEHDGAVSTKGLTTQLGSKVKQECTLAMLSMHSCI